MVSLRRGGRNSSLIPDSGSSGYGSEDIIYDSEAEEKFKYTHLTKSRRERRNRPAAILKKEDLKEEKLHEYFIELMQEEYKLKLTTIKWDFILDYPTLKNGNDICS